MLKLKRPWGSNFTAAEIESARQKGQLLSLELELSRECNLRCIYCYADAGEKMMDELSFDEIIGVIDQAIALGVRRIIVLGGGEPLLYPRIMEVMRYIYQHNIAIDLFTNGTLITREIADQLLELGVCPVIKLNSFQEDVQDLLAGKAGAYKAIQKGLDNLLAVGYPDDDYPLGIETIICRQNIQELPEMWIWAREKNIIPYFEIITLQGRARKHSELCVTSDEIKELFFKLSHIDREHYGIVWEPHPPIAGLKCNRHAYSCTVTVSGDVLPCPGVDIPVGNIRKNSLAEIISSSEVLFKLRHIKDYIKGPCKSCELSNECYGCRGMAYQVTGDYLASDPICWKNPERIL